MPIRLSRAGTRRPVPVFLLVLGAVFLAALSAQAQQQFLDSSYPQPRLASVLPTGGKAGTVVEASFTGVDLEEPEKLLFSHPGFKAELVPPPPPDPKKPPPPPRNGVPAPVTVKFKITIPADAPLGFHDVRVAGKWGVSNPRTFVVGDLPEVLEKEPNNDVPEAQRVDLNSTINGTMASSTDVDYYVFAGKKGQRVVFNCRASSIDSRFLPGVEVYDAKGRLVTEGRNYSGNDALTDCVLPDDGDYYVRLFEFTHTANIPSGLTEYFYRLTITTAPWIDAIFPAVLEPGKATPVTIYGRNLPGGQLDPASIVDEHVLEKLAVTITAPNDAAAATMLAYSGHISPAASGLDGFEYRVKNDAGTSNPFMLTFARAPVVLDNGSNRTPETAQEVAPPCEIAGRFEKIGARDWFTFTAKKGDAYNLEVLSDRIGAPTLIYLIVRDSANKTVYESPLENLDSFGMQFFSRTEDPAPYKFTAPADGKFFVKIGSQLADTVAGPRYYYRLRITPDQPDFRLVATGSAISQPDVCVLRQAGSQSLTVFAWRRDGFAGDIALSIEGLPPGVTCPPQVLGAGVRQTQIVLTASPDAAAWSGEIKVKGTATIKGQPATREARAGGVVWALPQPQAAAPLVGRVERSLVLAVRPDKAPYTMAATIDKAVLTQGDPVKGPTTASITAKVTRLWPDLKQPIVVQVPLNELPGVLNQAPTQIVLAKNNDNNNPPTINADKDEVTIPVAVGANVPPGVYNIILRTSMHNHPFIHDPKATPKPAPVNINLLEPGVPLTITVLPRVVGTLTLANPNPTVKPGAQVEVVVKVARLWDYAGEFKVSLAPPANVKDVTAAEATIPAGKDEATLVLTVPATAAPGGRNDLVVRAVAMVNGNTPTTQEVKFNLNVAK